MLPPRISRKSDKAEKPRLPVRWATNSIEDRFRCSFEERGGCWEWDSTRNEKGYGWFCAFGKKWAAHRVSYRLFKGPIPDGLHVCHSCDNRGCVNPNHLWLGTHADNMRDMTAKGRRKGPSRDAMPWRKLTENDVREIMSSTEPGTVLGPRYGVTKGTIYAIRNRTIWKDITRASPEN